ncbi:Cyclic pyranopterin monophosphate synthase 2 [archaeon HR06]|nr:Cyclic pyranopterin monophosphate synthase 2 [archaeon HR06]
MAKMIDISEKPIVKRRALVEGFIKLKKSTLEMIKEGKIEKGNPLQIASIAAINASKLTPFLLPLCHPLNLESVNVEFELMEDGVRVLAEVSSKSKTGVEMEALTTVSVALLTIWDVVKKYEKDEEGQYPFTEIKSIKVLKKVKENEGL